MPLQITPECGQITAQLGAKLIQKALTLFVMLCGVVIDMIKLNVALM